MTRSVRLQAVLWDMDGTLVDTEPYWIERQHEIVDEYGNGSWNEEHSHALVGTDLRFSARYISKHGDVDLAPDEIVNLMLDGVIARVGQCIPWRPGARELLADLVDAGVPCALVTMSWKRFTDAIVPVLPIGSFHTVVAGDDVVNGKPHHEPYLTAAMKLGVDPTRCVAIEDSPTGAASAVAAGCFTLVVPHMVPVAATLGDHRLASLCGVTAADVQRMVAAGSRSWDL